MEKKILKHFLNLNEFLFFIIYTIVLLIGLLETVTYEGFFEKRIHISLWVLLSVTLISGSLILFTHQRNYCLGKVRQIYYRTHFFLTPALFFFWMLLTLVESLNYENYVFSKIHITPSFFVIPVTLTIFFLITLKIQKAMTSVRLKTRQKFTIIIVYVFFLIFLNQNLKLIPYVANELRGPLKHPLASKSEKFSQKWGEDFYPYIEFIRATTPKSAIILTPSRDNPWGLEGNDHVMRAFLYPRKVISYYEGIDVKENKIDHILITIGFDPSNRQLFPSFYIKGEKIILFDPESKKGRELNTNAFNYKNRDYTYGVIKLK